MIATDRHQLASEVKSFARRLVDDLFSDDLVS